MITIPSRMVTLCSLLFLVGCTSSFIMPPLLANHPANPRAQIAPFVPPPNPLQPRQEGQAEHGQEMGPHGAPGAQMMSQAQEVEGEGKVIAVVPDRGQIVLEHGEIKGFMGAMTMGYKVKDRSLLRELTAGDKVRFTIDTTESVITRIVKEKP